MRTFSCKAHLPGLALKFSATLLSLAASAAPINYTYDAAGRLVLVDYGGNTNFYKIYDNSGNLVERSAPGPVMHHSTSGGPTTFAWTTLAGGFRLFSAPNLRPPIIWTPVAVTPSVSGGQFTATVNRPSSTVFYILRR